jgi:hypothetical protein
MLAPLLAFIPVLAKMLKAPIGTGLTLQLASIAAFACKSVRLRAQSFQKNDPIYKKHHNRYSNSLLDEVHNL